MTKSRAPAGENNYPENGPVKPPKRDTRALSPAGMIGGKALLRLAVKKIRLLALSVPMRSALAYFLCKWGIVLLLLRKHRGRGNDLGTTIRYLRKTTSGAAGIGLGAPSLV